MFVFCAILVIRKRKKLYLGAHDGQRKTTITRRSNLQVMR
jgi:hypothetical protein